MIEKIVEQKHEEKESEPIIGCCEVDDMGTLERNHGHGFYDKNLIPPEDFYQNK